MAASGARVLQLRSRRVRPQPRRPHPLPIELQRGPRYLCRRRGRDHGTTTDHRRHPLHRRGAHDAPRRPGQPGRRGPHLHRARRRERQRRHDHPERAGVRGRLRRHELHGPARRPPDRPQGARPGGLRRRHLQGRRGPDDGEGVGRGRGNEVASRRRREGVRHPRQRGNQHRDDLHLPDQDLLRRAPPTASRRPSAPCTRRSSSAPTTSAPSTPSSHEPARRRRGRHRRRGHRDAREAARERAADRASSCRSPPSARPAASSRAG